MLNSFLMFLFGWILVQEGQNQTTDPPDDRTAEEEAEEWEHLYEEWDLRD